VLVSWKMWKQLNPTTTALVGTDPPLQLPYETDVATPQNYLYDLRILYPAYGVDVAKTPMRFKSHVYGVATADSKAVKAYELALLREKEGAFEDAIGGQPVTLQFDKEAFVLAAKSADGQPLFVERMLWVSWVGIHPDTEVWQEARLREELNPTPPNTVPGMPTTTVITLPPLK